MNTNRQKFGFDNVSSVNISYKRANDFNVVECLEMLKREGFEEIELTSDHQKHRLKNVDLNIIFFDNTIHVQGKLNSESEVILKKLYKFKNLYFDNKNQKTFKSLFGTTHNSIVCTKCHKDSIFAINGEIKDNELSFMMECGHPLEKNFPCTMINSRILPDISVLFAGVLSKCIKCGHFHNFEIVIPTFILEVVDILHNNKKKNAVSHEIDKLRVLESENKISIFNCRYGNPIKDKDVLEYEEDAIIIKLANLTNSIIFTGDLNMKARTLISHRPTLFLHPNLSKGLKELSQNL